MSIKEEATSVVEVAEDEVGPAGARELKKLFRIMEKKGASDMHLKAGRPPVLRFRGDLRALKIAELSNDAIRAMLYDIMTEEQQALFEEIGSLDFAYEFMPGRRVRINVFRQRGNTSMAARLVHSRIPSIEDLHLPPVLKKIAELNQGLVLVCGVTGSGKSTTLAALIEHINETRRCHILTVEDPIEYLYADKKAFINQREMGLDVHTWEEALKAAVRQDPDVILVGEMRDPDTFAAGLTAAETGHLVFGTVHSSNTGQTFVRILDMFHTDRQHIIRQGLAFNLQAIVCQNLLPSCAEGVSVSPAVEVMLANPTIRKVIREGQEKQIAEIIKASREEGMQDFTQSIAGLIKDGLVEVRVGLEYAPNRQELEMVLRGIQLTHRGILT